jgi:hypothetical protein
MKPLLAVELTVTSIVMTVALLVSAQQPPPTRDETRPAEEVTRGTHHFTAVDIYIDAGDQPLAAYQLELSAGTGAFRIVALESGEHPAFSRPPYYDPAALSRRRIIIAAFSTDDHLPTGKTRVARVHLQTIGNQTPQYNVRLHLAATADGKKIPAAVGVQARRRQVAG